MKRKLAQGEERSAAQPRPNSAVQLPSGRSGQPTPARAKTPARSLVSRLAAEVDALAAQLEASRARILELEQRIDTDPLTETLNRRGFDRELTRSLAYVKRYGTPATLIYLDLDGFKPINDRHGHAAGDLVLKAVAAALGGHVRASDVVARIGGDEFVVLLWNAAGATAIAKAHALEAAIYSTEVKWSASTLVVTASAGVAQLGPLDKPVDVLARADQAMYARKAERRQRLSAHRGAAPAAMSRDDVGR